MVLGLGNGSFLLGQKKCAGTLGLIHSSPCLLLQYAMDLGSYVYNHYIIYILIALSNSLILKFYYLNCFSPSIQHPNKNLPFHFECSTLCSVNHNLSYV